MTHRFHPHDEPDAQSLLDFGDAIADGTAGDPANELEATMLRVQRGLRATSFDTTSIPDDVRTRIREELMHLAAPPADIAGTRPAPRPKANRRQPTTPISHRPLQRMAWTGAANIALAIMLLIAAFGVWRVWDDSFGTGGAPTPGEGQYAYAPLVATPEATPKASNAISACDFSRSVPIYSGVDSPQVDGTVLYITSNGDLTLACPEESEPIVLSHNVVMASATRVSGVVQIQIPNGNTMDIVMVNVITGNWIQKAPAAASSSLRDMNMGRTLDVFPVVDSPSEWSVINLDTMKSATLSDLTDAKFPASHSITVATALSGKGVAVAFSEYKSEGSSTLASTYGAQGDVAVIADDLETMHWVSVPAYFPEVTNISLSPDASKLAFISNLTSYSAPTATTAISVVDVATGEEIVRSEEFIAANGAFFQWVEDGTAIVYMTDNSVYRLDLTPGSTPTELYSSEGALMLMPATTQSNLVHLKEQISDEETNLVILTTDS
ncbi:MAG TPA: hypothetical protein VNZ58_00240, partial [Thermomicrobiales bacterium]|nr:hypothetical protein [Thermomicrobiales bacterium]